MKNISNKGRWVIAITVAAVGVAWQLYSLSLIEQYVTTWPQVSDVIIDTWPRVDFGIFGELWFFGLIALFCLVHFRRQWRTTPAVITALGLMYFIRGWFLFLLPIGAPLGSVGADQRISIWGHEAHAFFPGGHIAILTILAIFTPIPWVRRVLWAGLIVFGLGTMLAKTHYTADSFGGILLGYAIATLVRQHWPARPEPAAAKATDHPSSGILQ